MPAKLPELLGRAFFVGYFAPAMLGVSAIWLLSAPLSNTTGLRESFSRTAFEEGVVGVALAAGLALVLMALNFQFIRAWEGYGRGNPLQLLTRSKARRLAMIDRQIEDTQRDLHIQASAQSDEWAVSRQVRLATLLGDRATNWPFEGPVRGSDVGNRIAAFETYPEAMYGANAVMLWDRLRLVLTDQARADISDSKALFDFWLNLTVMSLFTFAFSGYQAITHRHVLEPIWLIGLIGSGFTAWLAVSSIKTATMLWGDTMRAAFDVHLTDLGKRLGLGPRPTKEQWIAVSQAVTYGRSDLLQAGTKTARSRRRRARNWRRGARR